MTDQPVNLTPHICHLNLTDPCSSLANLNQLVEADACPHIRKTQPKGNLPELYAVMDSNCHRPPSVSPVNCNKNESWWLLLIATKQKMSRNAKPQAVTCKLKSLRKDLLRFPGGREETIFSILDLSDKPLWLAPVYTKSGIPNCEQNSVEVEKIYQSRFTRAPLVVDSYFWKEYPNVSVNNQQLILSVAIPASGLPADAASAETGGDVNQVSPTPRGIATNEPEQSRGLPESLKTRAPQDINLEDKQRIVDILARQASSSPSGPSKFFRNLIQQTDLPDAMKIHLANIGQDSPDMAARSLLEWAIASDVNPKNPAFTILGSILRPLIDSNLYGLETRHVLAATVVAYGLYREPRLLDALMSQFGIPQRSSTGDWGRAVSVGPEIDWRAGDPDLVLQSWPWSEPDSELDLGFLLRATERAASVCRVELPGLQRTGTGFLIAPDLVLTSYHVLRYRPEENLDANAADLSLRFGFITSPEGADPPGQAYRLAASPVVAHSPTEELDYVLLRADDSILSAEQIKPLDPRAAGVSKDKSLNIIHHPEGRTMKMSWSTDGVSGVYEESGRIQYVSRAARGSSGSPCFNDQWELVAMHHAQRARSFGLIREGILFHRILEEIKSYLP